MEENFRILKTKALRKENTIEVSLQILIHPLSIDRTDIHLYPGDREYCINPGCAQIFFTIKNIENYTSQFRKTIWEQIIIIEDRKEFNKLDVFLNNNKLKTIDVIVN